MNRDDVLDLFDGIRSKYIVEAIESRKAVPVKKFRTKKVFLIAAAVAMAALLVGCGIVYVLKMQDLKLDEDMVDRDWYSQEQHTVITETVPRQVLTLSGLKGSPSYQAAQEWYDFQQSYDPDHRIINSIWGNVPEFPEKYEFYNPYSQEMVDKIEEICAKYGLKLMGKSVYAQTSKDMMEYLGIENVLLPGAPASAHLLGTAYYEGGYFRSEFDILMDQNESDWPFQTFVGYLYSPKDCFNAQLYNLDGYDWQERSYTTQSGHNVLILRSPSYWESWAFCDVGNATITIRLETLEQAHTDKNGYPEVLETSMTDEQLNQILDTINFDLKLNPGDPSILEGQEMSADLIQTQNGYTVEVKEVLTDGRRTAITLSLTAPEDVDLEQYINDNSFYIGMLNFSDQWFEPIADADLRGGSGALNPRLDGDGKSNTVEFFAIIDRDTKDGIAFPKGSKTNLLLNGLYVQVWNEELSQFDILWSQEGIWNFEITLDDGNWQVLEFVTEPISIRANTGYGESGEDLYGDITVTSLTMRSFGGELIHTKSHVANLSDPPNDKFPALVLKDGSIIRLNDDLVPHDEEYWGKMIPLDEIDHLLLIDGTKLYPQR